MKEVIASEYKIQFHNIVYSIPERPYTDNVRLLIAMMIKEYHQNRFGLDFILKKNDEELIDDLEELRWEEHALEQCAWLEEDCIFDVENVYAAINEDDPILLTEKTAEALLKHLKNVGIRFPVFTEELSEEGV